MLGLILALIIVWLLYVLWKFGFKPYLRMQKYKQYEGSVLLPFIPVIGAFKYAQDAFEKTGDQNHDAKRLFQDFPGTRLLVFNALDKCFVSLTEPTLIQQFFQNQQCYVKQEVFLQNRIRFFGQGIAFTQGGQWSKRRKILSSLFHFSLFNSFITTITSITERQIKQILGAQNGQFEVQRVSQSIAGDVIVKTFFGIAFKEKIGDEQMAVWLSKLIADNVAQQRSLRYFLFGINILKLGLFAEDRSVNRRIKLFRSIAKNVIQSKLSSEDIKGTMLQVIRQKGLLQQEGGYTISEVIDQFMGFFVAGVDTTSHLLSMAFYYLTIHLQWQNKLRAQFKQSKIEEKLEFKNISALKFLQFFIKQTFRHYDYMVSLSPKRCLRTHNIGEIVISEGDVVMPGWSYLNYKAQYFSNPQDFDPLRWQKVGNTLNSFTFTPFSIGSRSCLGQNFALLEIKLVLIKYLMTFQMTLKPGYEHKLKTNSLYGPINPMYIQVRKVANN